ncbi:RNA polymerase sigma-70 factor, ECF subfamily [Evansella caseinilytica]|uniref:RNA polymerase sigma-70 factor, ECF subfamily n=1 Tax=Evansella caseinilytica TaxID=1503961 RepID=A0A1H3UXJ3_9BACI|nr:RNA polymerase sigma factor [Evansella caseinilytica]SDZ67077.1 RNA polymerase sigma-70 factor, ECF subfamily [Evansella caseinilytica]
MNTKRFAAEDDTPFDYLIAPYYQNIRKYCFALTQSAWEAEDLMQDTLMKLYLAWKKQPDREISKSFLYRIAKNTWIDQKRKSSRAMEALGIQGEDIEAIGRDSNELHIREALEILAEFLSTKQFVIVLLMDIFQFTAKETAKMIRDTETTVHTSLHRSRKKLQRCVHFTKTTDNHGGKKAAYSNACQGTMTPHLFETFMTGFKMRNPQLIYEAYLSLSVQGIQVNKVQSFGSSICFQFKDPDGNVLTICERLVEVFV